MDFKRDKFEIPANVAAIEYDPNRTARLALLNYVDGEKRYILAPVGLQVGDTVISGPNVDIQAGNSLPISNIPTGTMIHNIELKNGSRWPVGAVRRWCSPAFGQRRRLRPCSTAIG